MHISKLLFFIQQACSTCKWQLILFMVNDAVLSLYILCFYFEEYRSSSATSCYCGRQTFCYHRIIATCAHCSRVGKNMRTNELFIIFCVETCERYFIVVCSVFCVVCMSHAKAVTERCVEYKLLADRAQTQRSWKQKEVGGYKWFINQKRVINLI